MKNVPDKEINEFFSPFTPDDNVMHINMHYKSQHYTHN